MTRKNGAQGWSDAARVFPWWDTGLRHSPGADAFTRSRPAARVKAGRLAARAAGCLDARGSRRAKIRARLGCVVSWDIGEPGERDRHPKGREGEAGSGERDAR